MKLRQQQFGARLCAKHQPQHTLSCGGGACSLQGRARSPLRAANVERHCSFEGRRARSDAPYQLQSLRGFTLVELVVVMTLLVTVIALASPSLAGFFRGRAVEVEARRFMSLTRLGQSRAASEGLPMILWVDATSRTYGLESDSSFVDQDARAVEYTLDGNLTVEIGATASVQGAITGNTFFDNVTSSSKRAALPHIRFEPDGGVSESSPESFRLMDRDGGSLWVGLSVNRLNYEIRNHEVQRVTKRR